MNIYLEFKDDSSQKFWEAKQTGNQIAIKYGKINADGRLTNKEYNSEIEAKKDYVKLVKQKLKKGYKRLGKITNLDELDINVYNNLDEVKEINYPKSFLDYGYLNKEVVVIKGDVFVEGDLNFDCVLPGIFEKHNEATYIFMGDLNVSGYFMHNAATLVLGSVKSNHYEHYGLSYLNVQGEMQINGALIGADDHGTLEVKDLNAFFTICDWNAGFNINTDMSFWSGTSKGFIYSKDSEGEVNKLNKKDISTIFSDYANKAVRTRGLIDLITCLPDKSVRMIKKYIDNRP